MDHTTNNTTNSSPNNNNNNNKNNHNNTTTTTHFHFHYKNNSNIFSQHYTTTTKPTTTTSLQHPPSPALATRLRLLLRDLPLGRFPSRFQARRMAIPQGGVDAPSPPALGRAHRSRISSNLQPPDRRMARCRARVISFARPRHGPDRRRCLFTFPRATLRPRCLCRHAQPCACAFPTSGRGTSRKSDPFLEELYLQANRKDNRFKRCRVDGRLLG